MSGLWLLFKLRARGGLRSWFRLCKTPSGAFRAFLTLGFVGLMIVPGLIFGLMAEPAFEHVESARFALNHGLPAFIALFFYRSMFGPGATSALDFRPAEIEFLFSAPVSRRELLSFKLMGIVSITLAACFPLNCCISVGYTLIPGNFWWAFGRGLFMMFSLLLFMRLVAIWMGLMRKSAFQRLVTPIAKGIGFAALLLLMLGAISVRNQLDLNFLQDITAIRSFVATVFEAPLFQLAISPFRIFSNVLLYPEPAQVLLWGGLSLLTNVALLFLIVVSDANFQESEIRIARLKAEVLRKQQNVETAFATHSSSGTLPMLPHLWGAGPITWRQLQTFNRSKKILIGGFVLYLIGLSFAVYTDSDKQSSLNRCLLVSLTLGTVTLLASLGMPMGFKSDIKKMDIFKSLPMSSSQIAAGQLLGPILAITAFQYLTIAIFFMSSADYWQFWLAALAFGPLVTTLLVSISNVLSLMYPLRSDTGMLSEFERVGHLLVFVLLLGATVTVVTLSLTATAYLCLWLTNSTFVTALACWLVMLLACALAIAATAKTFERFDVSRVMI